MARSAPLRPLGGVMKSARRRRAAVVRSMPSHRLRGGFTRPTGRVRVTHPTGRTKGRDRDLI